MAMADTWSISIVDLFCLRNSLNNNKASINQRKITMMYRRPTKLQVVPRQTRQTGLETGSEMAEKMGFAQTRFVTSCPIDSEGERSRSHQAS